MFYLFCKWMHILAIISWMAGILYLWRIFVNHRDAGFEKEDINALLTGMANRLYRYITVPAMIVSWIFGCLMLYLSPAFILTGWFVLKFLCVIALTYHTLLARKYQRRFQSQDLTLPLGKFFRFMNEVPTLLMIIVVGAVVFKPF